MKIEAETWVLQDFPISEKTTNYYSYISSTLGSKLEHFEFFFEAA